MSDQKIWYIFQNEQQGPFSLQELRSMQSNNRLSADTLIFKDGWDDWQAYKDCSKDLQDNQTSLPHAQDRSGARFCIQAKVIVHNNRKLVLAKGVNLSRTGVFIDTKEWLFDVGDNLKMTVKAKNDCPAFQVHVRVIRFNKDPNFPMGFGFQFINLEEGLKNQIDQLSRKYIRSDAIRRAS